MQSSDRSVYMIGLDSLSVATGMIICMNGLSPGGPDTQAPSAPSNLNALAVSSSRIDLTWDVSIDNVGIGGYRIYRDSSLIATVTGTSYSDTGLTASTLYNYDVQAFDTSDNNSTFSSASATTLALDLQNPTVSIVSPLDGASVSGSVIVDVSASDNVAVDFVELYADSVLVGTDNTSPYGFNWNSLTVSDGNHVLRATAVDTSGNSQNDSINVDVDNSGGVGFTFGAAGDHGSTPEFDLSLAELANINPDFYLALGDLRYSGRSITEWCNDIHTAMGSNYPFEIVAGNHEDFGIFDYLPCLPDRLGSVGEYAAEYYFDYNNLARFIMISPDLDIQGIGVYQYTQGNGNYTWVENKIDEARALGIPWVIVGMHKLCLSPGDKACEIGEDLNDMLIAKNVDLVLQSHAHIYARSKQLTCGDENNYISSCVADDGSDGVYTKGGGTVFVVAGAFGHSIRPVDPVDSDSNYFATWMGSNANPTYGFMSYSVTPSQITGQYIGSSGGDFTDSFSIVSSTCSVNADCDDGLFCNGAETCSGGVCVSGVSPCIAGETCNEALNICEAIPECSVNADCDDDVSCTVDSCSSGVCSNDVSGCDCSTADGNTDGGVDVADLADVIINSRDVNTDGNVDLLDLVFVASRIGVC